LQFRNRLGELYQEVFSGGEAEGLSNAGVSAFSKKWGWYGLIHGLTGGDILKADAVVCLPLHKALLWQSYILDLQEVQNTEIKKISNAKR
jgi:hypothetical protein